MELTCECGSQYFIEMVASKYTDVTVSPTIGFKRRTQDPVKVYQCLNSKCKKMMVPEIRSFTLPKEDLKTYEEMVLTEQGNPTEIAEQPRRQPRPGEVIKRQG